MSTFIAVYFVIGIVVCVALYGWVAVVSIRRHGFSNSVRGASKTFVQELPLYPRVPVVAWLFVVGLPSVVLWTVAKGEWDPGGTVFVGLVWLLFFALLRWHYRAKARVRSSRPRASVRRHS